MPKYPPVAFLPQLESAVVWWSLVDSMGADRCCAGPLSSKRSVAMGGRSLMAIFLPCLLLATATRRTAAAGSGAEGRSEVINTQVQRKIDVSTQFAKVRRVRMSNPRSRSLSRKRAILVRCRRVCSNRGRAEGGHQQRSAACFLPSKQ